MLTVASTPLKSNCLVNFALNVHKLCWVNCCTWHNFSFLCLDFKDYEGESLLKECWCSVVLCWLALHDVFRCFFSKEARNKILQSLQNLNLFWWNWYHFLFFSFVGIPPACPEFWLIVLWDIPTLYFDSHK